MDDEGITLGEALGRNCAHGVPLVIYCPKCNPEKYVLSEEEIMRLQAQAAPAGLSFQDVVLECVQMPELVKEFDRLYGTNVALRGEPINVMIDKSSGRWEADLNKFFKFVFECVWLPVVADPKNVAAERKL